MLLEHLADRLRVERRHGEGAYEGLHVVTLEPVGHAARYEQTSAIHAEKGSAQ